MKKNSFVELLTIVVGIPFETFVLMALWNWFVQPLLGTQRMTFFMALGVSVLIDFLRVDTTKLMKGRKEYSTQEYILTTIKYIAVCLVFLTFVQLLLFSSETPQTSQNPALPHIGLVGSFRP